MDLDLRLVRYFVAVAGELHFGRAAAQLHISQPALSKQIRRLEEQLGASLLIRDSRHVTLTTYGQRFLNEARPLLAMAENMQQPPDSNVVHIAHIFELHRSIAVARSSSPVTSPRRSAQSTLRRRHWIIWAASRRGPGRADGRLSPLTRGSVAH